MASLSSHVIEADDVVAAAQFVLLCKRGDANAAAQFLRRTLAEVDGSALDMSTLSSTLGYDLIGSEPRNFGEGGGGLQPLTFVGDDLDKQNATLMMLIPGDMHVVGHLIGKGGLEIGKIEAESGAAIKIEAHSHVLSNTPQPPLLPPGNSLASPVANGQQNERMVSITGTVVSCVKAQRLLDRRLRARLESDGIHREVLRIVVPNDFVRHLIGKGGINISQLQAQTAIRIQVQAEANMAPNQLGRVVTFQGVEHGRAVAQYFVSRQIAEGPFRDWPQPQAAQPSPASHQQQSLSPSSASYAWPTGSSATSAAPDWSYMEPSKPVGQPSRDHTLGHASPTISPPSHYRHGALPGIVPMTLSSPASGIATETEEPLMTDMSARPIIVDTGIGDGSLHDAACAVQLTVPSSAVAFLIGRGGSTVNEMEQKSGARIRFAKQVPGDSVRVVEIRGSPNAVRNANSLVQARIEAYVAAHLHHPI